MKFTKEYKWGGCKRCTDPMVEDYIVAYVAEDGTRIRVVRPTRNIRIFWYEVNDRIYGHLADAKKAVETK